jgi:hypothetical protein
MIKLALSVARPASFSWNIPFRLPREPLISRIGFYL